jgi:hypothetical protein
LISAVPVVMTSGRPEPSSAAPSVSMACKSVRAALSIAAEPGPLPPQTEVRKSDRTTLVDRDHGTRQIDVKCLNHVAEPGLVHCERNDVFVVGGGENRGELCK